MDFCIFLSKSERKPINIKTEKKLLQTVKDVCYYPPLVKMIASATQCY